MVYVSTHAGKHHKTSEDSVLVGTEIVYNSSGIFSMPKFGFICVADGVGGNRGGAQASHFVLESLAKWSATPEEDLKSFLFNCNNNLITFAAKHCDAPEMATTLTGIFVAESGLRLVHVGNTRAYIKQGKYLKQITSDHTIYNWLIRTGKTDAAERCNKNEITNCFGGENPALLSKLYIADCQQFSLALLTSDGVHDYVDLDTLEGIITGEETYIDKCEEIIRKAISAGSEDDLSVVIICPSEAQEDE